MKFKKIYVEITNRCSLNCSFCQKLKREFRDMSVSEFSHVIDEIKDYTKYIYLHVKGEPLIHPYLLDILKICEENNIRVNITTNGTNIINVIDTIKNSKCIRQINVSLHALEAVLNREKYLENIVSLIKEIEKTEIYLSLRIWINNEEVNKYINDYLHSKLKFLPKNVFFSYDVEFEWPSLESDIVSYYGSCLGTKTHVGILSNGDVVPCCLDGNCVIKLGNIFEEKFSDILDKDRYKNMRKGFNDNKLVEELCQKCKYRRK